MLVLVRPAGVMSRAQEVRRCPHETQAPGDGGGTLVVTLTLATSLAFGEELSRRAQLARLLSVPRIGSPTVAGAFNRRHLG